MQNLAKKLSSNEIIELDEYLKNNIDAENVNSITRLDAAFKVINMQPELVFPSQWQSMLFGELEFESDEQVMYFFDLVHRFYNQTNDSTRKGDLKPLLLHKKKKLSVTKAPENVIKEWCLQLLETSRLCKGILPTNDNVVIDLLPFAVLSDTFSLIGEKDDDGNEITDDSHHKKLFLDSFERNLKLLKTSYSEKVSADILPFKRPRSKTGRNELCVCGSGQKYKKCCLNK